MTKNPSPHVRKRGSGSAGWTAPPDLLASLRRLWVKGTLLSAHLRGEPWQPVAVPLKGPSVADLAADLLGTQQWVARWRTAYPRHLRLEERSLGGRVVGTNTVPCRAWVDSASAMWALLGVGREVTRLEAVALQTAERVPALLTWVQDHPLRALQHETAWETALGAVEWVLTHDAAPQVYLRQLDAPGVDTKFLETHRRLICTLLDHAMPRERIDDTAPRNDLVARFGFRARPDMVRMRSLDPDVRFAGGFSEISVRADELRCAPVPLPQVLVVENEITYLALPDTVDTLAVLGGGYAVSRLARLRWLHELNLTYWGDLDTHGFAILDGLRRQFPRVRSLLMDSATLLDHEQHWSREPVPVKAELTCLTHEEQAVYDDLRSDAFGPGVRLEQERIRFGAVRRALADCAAEVAAGASGSAAAGG